MRGAGVAVKVNLYSPATTCPSADTALYET
jgi:hypothetical protein